MASGLYRRLCDAGLLEKAWHIVRHKGSEGGFDRVSVDDFEKNAEENIRELLADITAKTYCPRPYRQISFKKDKGGTRTLGLPAVRDKILQVAVKMIIEPIFEKKFLNVSYGYRQQKGPQKAVSKARHLIVNEKRDWITLCDIDKYFDTIPHAQLMEEFSKIIYDEYLIHLTELWLKMGKIGSDCHWKDNFTGTPQGGVISPLLANLYLHPLDVYMVEKNYGYIRYADDFIILSRKEGEAFRALNDVRAFVTARLQLALNPGATVKKVDEGFEFLGIYFTVKDVGISDEKFNRIKNNMANAIHFSNGNIHGDLFDCLNGIARYYALIIGQEKLEMIDWALVRLLKEKTVQAYAKKLISDKKILADTLFRIPFFSESMRQRKKMIVDEIISALRKESKPSAKKIQKADAGKIIRKEKKIYRKLESRGMELIINKPGVFLGKTRSAITVKESGKKIQEVKLAQLKNISILSQGVTLSSNIIAHCVQNNISLDFIGYDGKPYAVIHSPFFQVQQQGQAQLRAFENNKASVIARTIVNAKIKNQLYLIKYYHKYRKNTEDDFNQYFADSIMNMEKLADEALELYEPDHETLRGKLFSTEGRAAAFYWKQVGLLLNDYIDFEGRVRQGATDTVNCLLNYGYGMLYTRIWEAIGKAKLSPYISFLHKPQAGKPTLVFDMIEEFRQQAVDRVVFALLSKGEEVRVERGLLDTTTRRRLAQKVSERLQTPMKYKGKETRLADIIEHQARQLAGFLTGDISRYKPFISNW